MRFNYITFFQEGMFKTNHFIYLILCIAIIVGFLLINKKYNVSFEKNVTFLVVICVLNEVCKICINLVDTGIKEGLEAGGYFDPRHLPFQLCSFQIFFFISLKYFIKKEETKSKLLGFMVPCLMIGASISLFIPTDGTSLTDPQVYRYFIYHACLIAFGIYLVVFKLVNIDFKAYLRNLKYLCVYAVICIWINGLLHYANANFMFLRRPPMDGLPLLNLDNGYHIYLITIISLGVVVLTLVHLPFIIVSKVKRKKYANN